MSRQKTPCLYPNVSLERAPSGDNSKVRVFVMIITHQ